MSLGEKILELRKKKGLSQEELGDKIKVTRQTISNWELNETSPNPEQLKKLSRELHVSIDELLDNDIKDIVVEKVSNTEKLSKTSLDLLKIIVGVILAIIIIFVGLVILKIIYKNTKDYGRKIEETILCSIYGEEHSYGIEYYELTGEAIALGGDAYFSDILDLEKYSDAHQIFNVINDYVKKNGGTCEMIRDKDLSDIVNMEIKEGTLTNTGATIIITENIDYNISYGEPYWIEKFNYENNTWEKLETKCDDCAFNLPAYSVTPDHPLELKHDWEKMYGNLSKGLYRLVKDVSFESDIPISEEDEYYIWVEFSID